MNLTLFISDDHFHELLERLGCSHAGELEAALEVHLAAKLDSYRQSPPIDRAPHSEDGERVVLASIMLTPAILPVVQDRLSPDVFHLQHHRLIYRTMLEIHDAGAVVDLGNLRARLDQVGALRGAGDLSYFSAFNLATLDVDLSREIEKLVKLSRRRRLLRVAEIRRRLAVVAVKAARKAARKEIPDGKGEPRGEPNR